MRNELPEALLRRPPVAICDKILLSMLDLAELIGLSEPSIRQLVRDGLPTVRVGSRVLFRRQSVEAWLALRESSSIDAETNEPTGDQP